MAQERAIVAPSERHVFSQLRQRCCGIGKLIALLKADDQATASEQRIVLPPLMMISRSIHSAEHNVTSWSAVTNFDLAAEPMLQSQHPRRDRYRFNRLPLGVNLNCAYQRMPIRCLRFLDRGPANHLHYVAWVYQGG
ncbi:hypothetical protein WHZ78_07315 [Bradyrhizobium symbiodeficiens]|uniref:hypothetical protein n=1 Tax=Bradyrhizobium symbiodeficiens TaxID=1404367 RepID=UPI0030D4E2FF